MTRKRICKAAIWLGTTYVLLTLTVAAVAAPNFSTGIPIDIYNANSASMGVLQVAIASNATAVGSTSCANNTTCPVILYQLINGSWIESARLLQASSEIGTSTQPSGFGPSGPFGSGLAISADGNTVFVGDAQAPCTSNLSQLCGVIDIYNKQLVDGTT